MKMIMYKIRNKETGEFSKGGASCWNIWTKKGGKTWSNIGHMKSHLNYMLSHVRESEYPYHNAEIVDVIVDLDGCFAYDVSVLVDAMEEKKAEEEAKREELHAKWVRERELKQLEELKKKYEEIKD